MLSTSCRRPFQLKKIVERTIKRNDWRPKVHPLGMSPSSLTFDFQLLRQIIAECWELWGISNGILKVILLFSISMLFCMCPPLCMFSGTPLKDHGKMYTERFFQKPRKRSTGISWNARGFFFVKALFSQRTWRKRRIIVHTSKSPQVVPASRCQAWAGSFFHLTAYIRGKRQNRMATGLCPSCSFASNFDHLDFRTALALPLPCGCLAVESPAVLQPPCDQRRTFGSCCSQTHCVPAVSVASQTVWEVRLLWFDSLS